MGSELGELVKDWPRYLTVTVLVMIRLSGLIAFAPIFSSAAIAPRIKAAFVIATSLLLAPAVAVIPGAQASFNMAALLGELGVGLAFGLVLSFLNEALTLAGALLGMQFSFSLVNLIDPNSKVETPVLGQMLGWLGVLVLIGAGLDRSLLAALIRSFGVVPVGHAAILAKTSLAVVFMMGGIFMAGLQLATPVIAAALAVEATIALVGRLSPQLPTIAVSVPLKTLVSYLVFIASLAVWPAWIEHRFTALLDAAGRLMVAP